MPTNAQTPKAPDQARSKIGRLPFSDRMAFNRMVRDRFRGSTLISWLAEHGIPGVNPENIRKYRLGPDYRAWLQEEAALDSDRHLAEQAMRLADSIGGSTTDKLKAIIAGKAFELGYGRSDDDAIATLVNVTRAVTDAERLELMRRQTDQRDQALALERQKFQRLTAALFLKWYHDRRAREIAEAPDLASDVQTERLGQLLFGEDWK